MNRKEDIVIVGGLPGLPQGKLMGQLATVSAVELGGAAIEAALDRAGVYPESVDAVVMGQVIQAGGAGQNPARQAAVAGGGIPLGAHAVTVNKVCLSGLSAIIEASRLLQLGEAEVVIAGGQESMSNAPHLLAGSRAGHLYGGDTLLTDSVAHDGLTDAFDQESMGINTDRANAMLGVKRAQQDRAAADSHRRAAAAQDAGNFDAEIAPVKVPQRRGTGRIRQQRRGHPSRHQRRVIE